MQSVSAAYSSALQSNRLIIRYFMWVTAFDRVTKAELGDGFWSGDDDTSADIYNPDTLSVENRTFTGIGRAMDFGSVSKVADMTVQEAELRFPAHLPEMEDLIRAYDLRYGRCELYRGLMDADTGQMVGPAEPRFFGFISEAPINIPGEGSEGATVLRILSQSHEFTRSNPHRRSPETQKLRQAGDTFYSSANAAASVKVFWGRKKA